MKITGKQIAMARILLDLNQKDLADQLDIARKTIMRIENGQSPGSAKTADKIRTYFENHNIVFSGKHGVNKVDQQIKRLQGLEGLKAFYNDVYETIKNAQSPSTINLYNGSPKRLIKWLGEEWYEMHSNRMVEMKDKFTFNGIVKEGETLLVASKFAEYRWFPESLFIEKTIYAYDTKLAYFDYKTDSLNILIIDQAEFTESFNILFNIAWDQVATKPPKSQGA